MCVYVCVHRSMRIHTIGRNNVDKNIVDEFFINDFDCNLFVVNDFLSRIFRTISVQEYYGKITISR